MKPIIAPDVTRCIGEKLTVISPCMDCARRLQLKLDQASKKHPIMAVTPVNGKCVYKIKDTGFFENEICLSSNE